jgi:hypothetical protein
MISIVYASDSTMDYVECWELDAQNLSGSNNLYTFTNYSTTFTNVGKLGGARQMVSGANSAINATSLQYDATNSSTIEMWINLSTCANDCAIIEWWSGTASLREYAIFQGSAGAYGNKIRFGTHNPSGSDISCDTSTAVSSWIGSWNFFQFVVNLTGGYIQVFVNNVSECKQSITGLQDGLSKFSIGNKLGGISTSSYGGQIDQIVYYKRALNETERSLDYNSNVGKSCFLRTNAISGPVNLDFIGKANFDKNFTRPYDIYFNYSVLGNYSYSEIFRNGTLVYNGTNKFFNDTLPLQNMTTYFYSINTIWNSTLFNNTNISLTTIQSNQTYPSLDNVFINFDKNISSTTNIWFNFSCIGNCTYYEKFRNTVLVDNSTNKYLNNSGLTNGTLYNFYIIGYWNSTLYNTSYINLSTSQTTQSSSTTIGSNLSNVETLLNQTLQENIKIRGAIDMLGWVFLIIIFLILGVVVHFAFWFLASAVFGLLAIITYMDNTFNTDYTKVVFFVLMFFLFIFAGFVAMFNRDEGEEEKRKGKGFYDVYN